jgi:solute carrier family 25 (mitochondrial citrate transporter), member 1
MSTLRHHQGANATLEVWSPSRGMSSLSRPHSFLLNRIQTKARGVFATASYIVKRETPLALYKGLGAVLSGIVPKMSIRFASFEAYKGWLADKSTGKTSVGGIFIAGLGAGTTEAVMVVTPMEVVKIRLQAQQHSLADPMEVPKYRNAGHAVYKIVREEGFSTLYRGVSLTALRQATNQGVYLRLPQG